MANSFVAIPGQGLEERRRQFSFGRHASSYPCIFVASEDFQNLERDSLVVSYPFAHFGESSHDVEPDGGWRFLDAGAAIVFWCVTEPEPDELFC